MRACNYKAVPQSNGEGGESRRRGTTSRSTAEIEVQLGKPGDDPKPEQSIGEGGIFWNHGLPSGAPRSAAWFHFWYIYNIRTATSVGQLKVPLALLGLQVLVLLHLLTA